MNAIDYIIRIYISLKHYVRLCPQRCGGNKTSLSKSPEFETPLVTPWLDWDTRIEAILNSYISDDEFSFVGFDEILWEIVNHFTTQEKPSANILDGKFLLQCLLGAIL